MPKTLRAAQTQLIDAILADYHTTRMSETPVVDHILSRTRTQDALAQFERAILEHKDS